MDSASATLTSASLTISETLLVMISSSSICRVAFGKRYRICSATSCEFSEEKEESTGDLCGVAMCLAVQSSYTAPCLYVKARNWSTSVLFPYEYNASDLLQNYVPRVGQ